MAETTPMGYVYYCVFCGFHSPERDEVPESGRCAHCAGALRSCPAGEYEAVSARLEAGRRELRPHGDGVLPLVALLTALWVIGWHDALVGAGVLYLGLGGALALGAAGRDGEPAGAWRAHAAAAAAGAVAVVAGAFGSGLALPAGVAAGGLLVAAVAWHVARHPGWRRRTDRHLALRLLALLAGAGAAGAAGVVDPEHAAACAASVLAAAGWVLAGAAVAERPAPTIADVKPGPAPAAAPERVA